MSRQYADHITVRCSSGTSSGTPDPAPDRFLWRRRWYRVRAVLQRWIEAGAWWRGGDAVDEYQFWRVEAEPERRWGAGGAAGHYDLCRHLASSDWFLVRTFD